MKVAVFGTKSYDRRFISAAACQPLEFTFLEPRLGPDTVALAEGHDAVCLFVNDRADGQILESLAELGIHTIALRCNGFNNIDLSVAEKNEIAIYRVPAYSPHAVAEHAFALIFSLNRKTHRAYNRTREGNFELEGLLGFDLVERTVGVIGTGEIGRVFAQIARGFGCKVIACDPHPNTCWADEAGVLYRELEELLAESEVISLHCPLTAATHHLINDAAFAQMRDGVMLINTGRGGLIDTTAAIRALKSKRLGYLGMDVYEEEAELFFEDRSLQILQDDELARLMTFPNVLVTGHQGFFTTQALSAIAETTVASLVAVARGETPDERCRVKR
ncbi:MAG: 2-hydroxyacid dehydrogenase [Verrucomicrobiota bacterium]